MNAIKISWAHLVNPGGQSLQGFWIMRGKKPLNNLPFETKKIAQEYLDLGVVPTDSGLVRISEVK